MGCLAEIVRIVALPRRYLFHDAVSDTSLDERGIDISVIGTARRQYRAMVA